MGQVIFSMFHIAISWPLPVLKNTQNTQFCLLSKATGPLGTKPAILLTFNSEAITQCLAQKGNLINL